MPIWIKKWKVPSDTSDKEYTVSLGDDNKTYGCSCPRWKFKRETCKHIQQVITDPNRFIKSSILVSGKNKSKKKRNNSRVNVECPACGTSYFTKPKPIYKCTSSSCGAKFQ